MVIQAHQAIVKLFSVIVWKHLLALEELDAPEAAFRVLIFELPSDSFWNWVDLIRPAFDCHIQTVHFFATAKFIEEGPERQLSLPCRRQIHWHRFALVIHARARSSLQGSPARRAVPLGQSIRFRQRVVCPRIRHCARPNIFGVLFTNAETVCAQGRSLGKSRYGRSAIFHSNSRAGPPGTELRRSELRSHASRILLVCSSGHYKRGGH